MTMLQLSEADEAFLAAGRLTFIFAFRSDGSPTGWPMTSEYLDGELTMSTYAKAVKTRVLASAGHLTAVVVQREGGNVADAVAFSAPVQVRQPGSGGPTSRSANQAPGEAALEVPAEIKAGVDRAEASGKRVVLSVRAEDMVVRFRLGALDAQA